MQKTSPSNEGQNPSNLNADAGGLGFQHTPEMKLSKIKFNKGDKVLAITSSYSQPGKIWYFYAEVTSLDEKRMMLKVEDGQAHKKRVHVTQLNTVHAFDNYWLFSTDTDPQVAGLDMAKKLLKSWHLRGIHTSCQMEDVKVAPLPTH